MAREARPALAEIGQGDRGFDGLAEGATATARPRYETDIRKEPNRSMVAAYA